SGSRGLAPAARSAWSVSLRYLAASGLRTRRRRALRPSESCTSTPAPASRSAHTIAVDPRSAPPISGVSPAAPAPPPPGPAPAGAEQLPDNGGVLRESRGEQERRLVPDVARVRIGAGCEETANGSEPLGGGAHQTCARGCVAGIGVVAGRAKQSYDVGFSGE